MYIRKIHKNYITKNINLQDIYIKRKISIGKNIEEDLKNERNFSYL